MKKIIFIFSILLSLNALAQNNFTLNVTKKGAQIPSTLYGLFFEDINFAADGGLYAEMIKNRSFEFPNNLQGWKTAGLVQVRTDEPAFDRNPHYVRLEDPGHMHKRTVIENEGFFGVALQQDSTYLFSVYARGQGSKIRVELCNPTSMGEGHNIATADIDITSNQWQLYTATLTARETVKKGVLRLFLDSPTPVDLDHVSLFPHYTINGLRADLVQALKDMHPGVFRFPGGCIVEGTDLQTRYQWKNSVGPVENRPLNENRWRDTFPFRLYTDYYQSYGLGFYEFFCLCEYIGAEALPVLSCGLACQFQNENPDAHVPLPDLQPYIDDALDLIEFANGDASTTWGKLRAQMGHKEPFNLKYIGIGNEQWNNIYPEHLEPFIKAIREKYPQMNIVGTSGPDSEGDQFEYLWQEMKRLKADLVDEHFYRPETWFLQQGNRYDTYDRKGPKVFAGEYACHGDGKKWNHFEASLLEAAFMTGIERNADVVHMATYAPLFAHIEGWQWRPDMIWYDNTRSVRSVSYYVQQLYATNKGTNVVSLTMNGKAIAGNDSQNGLFASAVYDANTNQYIVKIANTSDVEQTVVLKLSSKGKSIANCTLTTLHSDDMDADNTLDQPLKIVPVTQDNVDITNGLKVASKTFAVYRFTVK